MANKEHFESDMNKTKLVILREKNSCTKTHQSKLKRDREQLQYPYKGSAAFLSTATPKEPRRSEKPKTG